MARPKVDNVAVLAELLKNEETRKTFKAKLDNLVFHRQRLSSEQEVYREDVKATSEDTGLTSAFINTIVNSRAKGKETETVESSLATIELMDLLYGVSAESQEE